MSRVAFDPRMRDTWNSPESYPQPEGDNLISVREIKTKKKYCKPVRVGSCLLYSFLVAKAD